MQLKDISVLVTGGGSGLGAATARAMAAKGAKVAVIDMNKEGAEEVAAEIKGLALVGDVSEEAPVKEAIAKAEAAHGTIRVLVNCAGIGGAVKTVGKNGAYPLDHFSRIIKVNLIGSQRIIWPIAVGYLATVRHLAGWCELREDFRSFRIDRIVHADFLDERYPERRTALRVRWMKSMHMSRMRER